MNSELTWRKSSYSDHQGGECVEVATGPGLVLLRNSKITAGPHLAINPATWSTLLKSLSTKQLSA